MGSPTSAIVTLGHSACESVPRMNKIKLWYSQLGSREKTLVAIAGALAVLMTGGALAYAIASGGAVIASGETVVLIGSAATRFR